MNELELVDTSAQEVALHMAMCVNAEYIKAWGFADFFERLLDYTDDSALRYFIQELYAAQEAKHES